MKAYDEYHLNDLPGNGSVFHDLKNFKAQYESLMRSVAAAVNNLNEFVDKLPEMVAFIVQIMGKYGWFMGLDTHLVGQMAVTVELANNNSAKIDKILSEFYRKRIPLIQKKLNENFPSRSQIWNAGFGAHAKGEYFLCIPVFLAQADGIWQEGLNRQLYPVKTKKKKKSSPKKDLSEVLMSPLDPVLPINEPFDPKAEEFWYLNRHQVLHGKAVKYGTEINSLKAISFLDFVADIVLFSSELNFGRMKSEGKG